MQATEPAVLERPVPGKSLINHRSSPHCAGGLLWFICDVSAQAKLSEREQRLKNITASIRKREEARKEPGRSLCTMCS